jgi:hypothetical protein
MKKNAEMNQNEWLVCNDPRLMLDAMTSRISDRQLKLFSLDCYDLIQDFLSEAARTAVEVFKANLDAKVDPVALSRAEGIIESELLDPSSSATLGGIVDVYVIMLFDSSAFEAAQGALQAVDRVTPWTLDSAQKQLDVYEGECVKARQAHMTTLAERLREITENLF